jgi:hypothetical protein
LIQRRFLWRGLFGRGSGIFSSFVCWLYWLGLLARLKKESGDRFVASVT